MLSSGSLVSLVLLLTFSSTFAIELNLTVPQCTLPSFDWTTNDHGDSPCRVAAALESVCRGDGTWQIPPIPQLRAYDGPKAGAGNKCQCSSVVYSLLSACSLCQGGGTNAWTLYVQNCQKQDILVGSFVVSIPDGFSVPTWAYLDVTPKNTFEPDLAEQTANENQPDITKANVTSTTSSDSSNHSNSKAGAIAGGVVGGIAFLCIAAGAVFYFFRRKKKNAASHNQTVVDLSDEPKPAYLIPTPYYPPGTGAGNGNDPMVLYNPSDPSTFPSGNSLAPLYHQHHGRAMSESTYHSGTTSPNPSLPGHTVTSGQSIISGHGKSHSDSRYKGIPEV